MRRRPGWRTSASGHEAKQELNEKMTGSSGSSRSDDSRTQAQPSTLSNAPNIRPPIWSCSRDELLSAIPDLVKCTNGISWLTSTAPLILMDDKKNGITLSCARSETVELEMVRDFVLAISDNQLSPAVDDAFAHRINNMCPNTMLDVLNCAPPEVQAIIDANISGTPVVIFVSRAIFCLHWAILIPEECKFICLGFFRVESVWEQATDLPRNIRSASGHFSGQINWRFHCEWAACCDEFLAAQKAGCQPRPWWNLNRSGSLRAWKMKEMIQILLMIPPCAIEFLVGSIHTMHIVGWRCMNSTLVPSQRSSSPLRERVPRMRPFLLRGSALIADKPPAAGYAVSPGQVRDPHQSGVLVYPYNEYPATLFDASVGIWLDGMQTLTYILKDKTTSGRATVKHVFTGNTPSLQMEADVLFEDLQIHVPLRRAVLGTYFSCLVGASTSTQPHMTWENSPECVSRAKTCYSAVDHLELDCTTQSTILALLGSESTITFIPKSGLQVRPACRPGSVLADERIYYEFELTIHNPLEEDDSQPGNLMDVVSESEILSSTKVRIPQAKQSGHSVSIAMVHGDLVLLSGDIFEYSIKRSGRASKRIAVLSWEMEEHGRCYRHIVLRAASIRP
ncbi:hypothetical protein Hypma_005206 [Hypsizygus marmoreus]|uniref:Uncharacterized protein n=1 Tax=Hypsizygus marmoreus TaxID=39966 RepID=A0A369K2J7_HYPMA|nr:hypothetical protein Hypma_005206 [Hypsizygus marmoreus]